MLIGHGTFDGVDAKFNLVGADLESAAMGRAARRPARQGRHRQHVVRELSVHRAPDRPAPHRHHRDRLDRAAVRHRLPGYFVKAFQGDEADIDKNDRISIWEAFTAATADVRRYYQRRGQLSTERALLDDNGDGVGREAAGKGDDGSFSSQVYLDEPLPGAPPTDAVLLQLLQKRAAIEAELDELKVRRSFLKPAEYQQEFERLMIELARVNQDIRVRIKS